MPRPLPRKILSSDPELERLLNEILLRVTQTEIVSVKGGRLEPRGQAGRALIIDPTVSGTEGMVFKGEWSSAVAGTESVLDVWRVSTGVSAGTYVCVQSGATNTDPPSEGSPKWFMIAALTSGGMWL